LRDIVKPTIVLFLVCLVVSAALALTYSATKDIIEERVALDRENARKEVFTDAQEFNIIEDLEDILEGSPELNIITEVYSAVKDGTTAGYVMMAKSKGYGGEMSIIIGIDSKGSITGVKIGEHSETPGLGTKASNEPFMSQLIGITPAEPMTVVKGKKTKPEQVEAISGATITSKAVVKAVQAAVETSKQLADKEGISK